MNVTIKNLPDGTYLGLKEDAKRRGQSLNSRLIQILRREAEQVDRLREMRESRAELDRFREGLPPQSSSVPLIREDRDEH